MADDDASKLTGLERPAGDPKLDGLYLFFSYDLVNSTAYKIKARDWPVVMRHFYDVVEQTCKTKIERCRVWKRVGDEVLLYLRVRSQRQLEGSVVSAYEVLLSAAKTLENAFPEARGELSIKAAVWMADAEYMSPNALDEARRRWMSDSDGPQMRSRNILFRVDSGASPGELDFLGPDVDTGFRVAKHAEKNVLAVSAELAFALRLCGRPETSERLKVLSFVTLKGVWSGRHYPIVWYCDDWAGLSAKFWYDDPLLSPLIASALENTHEVKRLEQVFDNTRRDTEIRRLVNLLDEDENETVVDEVSAAAAQSAGIIEVHCVAICVDASDRILLARRPLGKRLYPNRWEFGCAQLRSGLTFAESAFQHYREDFGIEIEVNELTPPVDLYHFKKDGRTIPGVIMLARVVDTGLRRLHDGKHSEAAWFTREQILQLAPTECVPRLHENAETALHLAAKNR